jgi:hypothetical protein
MHSKYTTIAKLILNASKKVNDRRAVATTTKLLAYSDPTHMEESVCALVGWNWLTAHSPARAQARDRRANAARLPSSR